MDTLDLDRQLNEMIVEGRSIEALEKFYAEDVVAQENDDPERPGGREAWIHARQEAEKNMNKFDARVLASAANGDVSFSEWDLCVEVEGVGEIRVAQTAVRRWKDGKVVRERFYHK